MKNILKHLQKADNEGIGIFPVAYNHLYVDLTAVVEGNDDNNEIMIEIYKRNHVYEVDLLTEEDVPIHKEYDNENDVIICLDFNIALAMGNEGRAMMILLNAMADDLLNE